MTNKKDNSTISLLDYRKKKAGKQTTKPSADSPSKKQSKSQIVYMSNYLKTKKIPDLKELKEKQDKNFFLTEIKKEDSNLIILDQYRKEKNRKRVWKKQVQFYTKEALSVSGMAFLFLFTFNLAVSIKSNSPSGTFKADSQKIVRGENLKENLGENLEESLGLSSPNRPRPIANVKQKDKALLLSHKNWVKKIKQIDREKIILGKKPSSSDYTGF